MPEGDIQYYAEDNESPYSIGKHLSMEASALVALNRGRYPGLRLHSKLMAGTALLLCARLVAAEDDSPEAIASRLGLDIDGFVRMNKGRYKNLRPTSMLLEGTVLNVVAEEAAGRSGGKKQQQKKKNEKKATTKKTQERRHRCGKCKGCRARECERCRWCLDKKRYGGEDKLRKSCVQRRCHRLQPEGGEGEETEDEDSSSSESSESSGGGDSDGSDVYVWDTVRAKGNESVQQVAKRACGGGARGRSHDADPALTAGMNQRWLLDAHRHRQTLETLASHLDRRTGSRPCDPPINTTSCRQTAVQ